MVLLDRKQIIRFQNVTTPPGKKGLDFENQFTTLSRQFTTYLRQFTTFFAPILPSKLRIQGRAAVFLGCKIGVKNVVNWRESVVNWFSKSKLLFSGVSAKFCLSKFFDFWRRCAVHRQNSKILPSLIAKLHRIF